MTPRPEAETRQAQRRQLEERRARDFGKFLESLERIAPGRVAL